MRVEALVRGDRRWVVGTIAGLSRCGVVAWLRRHFAEKDMAPWGGPQRLPTSQVLGEGALGAAAVPSAARDVSANDRRGSGLEGAGLCDRDVGPATRMHAAKGGNVFAALFADGPSPRATACASWQRACTFFLVRRGDAAQYRAKGVARSMHGLLHSP